MKNTRRPAARSAVWRFAVSVLAIICLILGVITLPLPLPTGLIFFVLGFALLLTASRRARIWFRSFRRRAPWLDARLSSVEHRLPDDLRRALSPRQVRKY